MARKANTIGRRRLIAIAFADVANFSRLVAQDDLRTGEIWRELQETLLLPLIARFDGALVGSAGDSLLVSFQSAISALEWAVESQKAIEDWASELRDDAIRLRISVNVDEVLDYEESVIGDGINIAARLHSAADPGQIIVTSLVRELVGGRVDVTFKDIGTPRLKNIERIVHAYLVQPNDGDKNVSSTLHHPYLEWSSRPAVAVLPFDSATGDKEELYFGTGITEDIITGLSRSHAFHVIARASSQKLAEKTEDVQDIAAKLGVNYVLCGSVRRDKGRLRISAQLVNVSMKHTVWAEQFQGETRDIFDFQDEIVSSVVGSFEPRLQAAEAARVRNRPTHSLHAYDCVLKASSQLYLFTRESFLLSEIALQRALELDPEFARAHAMAAWRLNFLYGEERSDDVERDKALAFDHAQRAIALDPHDAFCQVVAAHLTSLVKGDPESAMQLFDNALSLDQNNAMGWATSGITLSYLGCGDEAMTRFRNAFRLSPFDSLNFSWWCGAGMAEFVNENYAEAVRWLTKAYQANPRYAATLRMLAAALANDGKAGKAKSIANELLALDQDFSVERFVSWYPLARAKDKKALKSGLLRAGLPH